MRLKNKAELREDEYRFGKIGLVLVNVGDHSQLSSLPGQ